MGDIIGADPWNLQPHRKKSDPCSPNNLRFDIKRAVLKASTSVVGILTHLGEMEIYRGSGFVIECNAGDNKYCNTILTSATILRSEPLKDELIKDIEISVILTNDITCKGFVSACNFHYNIGMIKFETEFQMETARLRYIDDSISIDPNLVDENPVENNHLSGKYVLYPGDTVVALGRNLDIQNTLMVVAGVFSVNEIRLDCKELFRADFEISKHGTGGPLINCYGEVIGLNFYGASFTPFLPINIVSMWWEQYKKNSHHLVPQLGMRLSNLCAWGDSYLEIVIRRLPNTFKGVVVKKITSKSPSFDDILQCDIIVECDEQPIGSVLELFELIWDKVGKPVNLTVLRPSDGSQQNLTMIIDNVGPNEINRWPLPKERKSNMMRWRSRIASRMSCR